VTNDQDLRPIFMDDQGKMKYRGDDGRLYYLSELGEPVSRWSYYFGHTVLVVTCLIIGTLVVGTGVFAWNKAVPHFPIHTFQVR